MTLRERQAAEYAAEESSDRRLPRWIEVERDRLIEAKNLLRRSAALYEFAELLWPRDPREAPPAKGDSE